MFQPIPNSNLTFLGGQSVHDSTDSRYLEYRRQWMENPKNFIIRDFPIHLDIEITSRCNLKCTFCDKLPLLSKDQIGDMDLALFRKIIDEGSDNGLCSVKLSYRGEPLLHPRVDEMVDYAKKRGVVDIYFNTNGMLLTEERVLRLMDAGLDRISISIEGTDPEAFERERRGAKYHKILENIESLIELRTQKGLAHPKIRVQTVALPGIDLDEYARFWEHRCDETAAVDYKEVEARNLALIDPEWACPQLWQRMTIEWDGAVMPCNNDDYKLLSPGYIGKKTIYQCWHDALVNRARDLHKRGQSHLVQACNGCPWRTTQILKKRRDKRQILPPNRG